METDLPEEQNRKQLPLWPESTGLGERHNPWRLNRGKIFGSEKQRESSSCASSYFSCPLQLPASLAVQCFTFSPLPGTLLPDSVKRYYISITHAFDS